MHFAFLKSGFLMALIANALIGISLVWDKVLLRRPQTKNLVNYVFWLGVISIFGLALIPFGFKMPRLSVAALGFGAGVLHLVAIYFYYDALNRGEASESLAVVGGFSPVATALIAFFLLRQPFAGGKVIAFGLLTGGGFLMFLAEEMNFRGMIFPVAWASGLFGLVNVLQRMVFRETNFVSGYVFFTIGTCVGALLLLIPPGWRKQIFKHSEESDPRSKFWYFLNRFIDGVGSFLIFYAISLTHPAIVDAISGVRFAIIFIGALLLTRFKPDWLREDFTGRTLLIKTIATAIVVAGMVWLSTHGGHEEAGAATTRLHQLSMPSWFRREPIGNTVGQPGQHSPEHGGIPRKSRSSCVISPSCVLLKTSSIRSTRARDGAMGGCRLPHFSTDFFRCVLTDASLWFV